MQGVTESMAGRAAVLQLRPLSTRESRKVSLLLGGYPEALARPGSANQSSLFPGPDSISGSAWGLGHINHTFFLRKVLPRHAEFRRTGEAPRDERDKVTPYADRAHTVQLRTSWVRWGATRRR